MQPQDQGLAPRQGSDLDGTVKLRSLTPVQLWVQALRSGDYKQGRSALKNPHGYCCLGVACEVFPGYPTPLTRKNNDGYTSYNNNYSFLPDIVRRWLGLSTKGGHYNGGSLVNDNDASKTFSEIADIIESRPEGLFVDTSQPQR